MSEIIRTETRQRGPFGKLVLALFWIFNLGMAASFVAGLGGAGETMATMQSDAERAGAAIGTAVGAGMILTIWFLGAAILGMMVMFTRGKTIVTETRRD